MIFIGNGDTAACHHPADDFNDEAIPHGVPHQGERRRDRRALCGRQCATTA
jgi:hypothetical protein